MAKVVMEYSSVEKTNKAILENLRELGEGREAEGSLTFGQGYSLPSAFENDVHAGVASLIRIVEAEEEEMTFNHELPYKPWDGAVAVNSVFKKFYGTGAVATVGMFGANAQIITIDVGLDEQMDVMWGQLDFPVCKGTLNLGTTRDEDGTVRFAMALTTAKKNQAVVQGFWKVVEAELQENSIYRGKAIDDADMPKFIDISEVDEHALVFNEVTRLQLSANIWSPITHREVLIAEGVDTKRTILLEGPYGTGKSEVGLVTAQKCVEHGRTFLLCNPKDNNVFEVLKTAAQYQPATVFIEDCDTFTDKYTSERLLDAFDGILSKNIDIQIVMTTNHKDRLLKGMLRPGRLDACIHMGPLDDKHNEELIRKLFKEELTVDFSEIAPKLSEFTPAFVVEMAKKVKLFAITRAQGTPDGKYETLDFLASAQDMRDHFDLHSRAGEGVPTPTLDVALREVVLGAIEGTTIEDENGVTATQARS
jgi:ATPase family associated with various cellular activities (AAA)